MKKPLPWFLFCLATVLDIELVAKRLAETAELRLVMVGPGDGAFARQLRERAEALGIGERVTWTGMVSGDLKWGAFHAAEVFVLPSHQENFGISVAEALACSLPVLISDKVNIWREIADDRAGLVAGDDLAGTGELLERWLQLSEAERQAMRARARSCFENRFEIEQAGRSLTGLPPVFDPLAMRVLVGYRGLGWW